MTEIRLINKATGARIFASVFSTEREARNFSAEYPRKIRNASGSLINHGRRIITLADGRFAVL